MDVLSKIKSDGSTWVPYKGLTDTPGMENLKFDGYATIGKIGDIESRVAENIMKFLKTTTLNYKVDESKIDSYIDEFERAANEGRKLHQKQRDAVKMVLGNPVSILTGGPGTGKTTVLSAIAYCLRKVKPGIKIVYTAPTGKAAARISESTGENATTLHKKLHLGYEVASPEIYWNDCIFVDESSMIDLSLADNLFRACTPGCQIVLVGDPDQLPSVGIGTILRDLIRSEVIPCTMLTKTFRQDNSSVLFQNIQKVREGKSDFEEGSDFCNVVIDDNANINDIAKKVEEMYLDRVNKFGVENVCMLIPYRRLNKNVLTSEMLNMLVRDKVNPKAEGVEHSVPRGDMNYNRRFCVDDLVMQLQNRPECANGEVGKIITVDIAQGSIVVKYNDIEVMYKHEELEQIDLAYAMSVHKSQGSEYKSVIMVFMNHHKAMLNKNLVYTGITRAKKECLLIYQKEAMNAAVKVAADVNRFSMLDRKIQQLNYKYF